MKRLFTQRGYTLLFATITATVVLGVAVFVTSISRKQFILSSASRDSMYAVYNADSALECGVSGWISGTVPPSGGSFVCNGTVPFPVNTFVAIDAPDGWDTALSSEPVIIPFASGSEEKGCATVTFIEGTKNGEPISAVEARGYNLGNGTECPKIGPRTVERALRITYE